MRPIRWRAADEDFENAAKAGEDNMNCTVLVRVWIPSMGVPGVS